MRLESPYIILTLLADPSDQRTLDSYCILIQTYMPDWETRWEDDARVYLVVNAVLRDDQEVRDELDESLAFLDR